MAPAECADVAKSGLFNRKFDAAVAWGLLFLLQPDVQLTIIRRVARVLNSGGQFLFTAPRDPVRWVDVLTGRESISLGSERYGQALRAEGLTLRGEQLDEGDNHYYLAEKS